MPCDVNRKHGIWVMYIYGTAVIKYSMMWLFIFYTMWRVNLVELAKTVCPFHGCDKSFRKPSQLKQHQRMHTGEVRCTKSRALSLQMGAFSIVDVSGSVVHQGS